MPLPQLLRINTTTEKQIKLVARCVCELCEGSFSPDSLDLHHVPSNDVQDKQRCFLILCNLCHRHVHAMPLAVEEQIMRVDRRPYSLRKMIRKLLGYQLNPYTPPDTPDLAKIYEDACANWCLNGSG